ncbi:Signal transduction response regulator / Disease resistance domain-containing protein [Alloactinosynnema sp. L-07]|uniref:BTAD domain-containing putative transcriptional regulator n=1 Tax=Alloactinosynnema sp. L-07 TaxID=1653480 RepID=UPI00065EF43D|nr:BTAD domain-containing putative transcriptional regulator [Alloactinosynnema sp. L-07]CRK57362.1 Signal transduction response regulator / Disease resistance domain-containing protein [Alloactinosynnema sp. L-07]
MSDVDVRLLGPLVISGPSGVPALSGARQRTLLALLALKSPELLSRSQLIDALWGVRPPPTAVRTLQSHLVRVRQALAGAGLADALVTVEPGYLLRLPAGALDVVRFEEHVAAGRRALGTGAAGLAARELRAGLALWRGDPLADCPTHEWAAAEVDRLSDLKISAATALAEANLRQGAHAEAVGEVEQLVARYPFHERLWELLVIAYHRGGRQGDALRAFQRAREVLVRELGIEPGAGLRSLEAAVLAGAAEVDPATAAPVVARAAPVTTLVGRTRELADIGRLLGRARLVTLTGPGGCGKTRLAVSAAERAGRRVAMVDLTPVASPDLVVDAVATALGVPERPGTPRLDTLVGEVGDVLVVLDNCEHLVRACADLVSPLLAACPSLTVLATSREALRVAGESVYEVAPLAVPDPTCPRSLAELSVYDSVRLFLDRATEQGAPGFTDDDATAIARLCAALDGLPLAIELAAARTSVLAPAQIARRLRDRFGLLTLGPRGAPEHHRTLLATLAWSFDLLDADEAALFPRLGVFAGGFSLEAAEAVWEPTRALDAVTGLVAKSLVRVRRENGVSRFSLLESVSAYAGDLLAADPSGLADAQVRHAAFFLAQAESADADPTGVRLADLRADHDNLRAAISWSPHPLRLAAALGRYCHLHGHYREGRRWLATALSTSDEPAAVTAKALAAAASLALFECDYPAAADHAEAALRHAAGEHRLTGRLHRLLGSVARETGRYADALAAYAASAAGYEAAGDHYGLAYSRQLTGATSWLAGDLDTADHILNANLHDFHTLSDRKGAASTSAYLGAVALYRGESARARARLDHALETFGELEFKEGIAWALNLLGLVEYAEGNAAGARPLLTASLALHRELGDHWRQASVLEALALVDPDESLIARAREIRTRIGAPVPAVERNPPQPPEPRSGSGLPCPPNRTRQPQPSRAASNSPRPVR